MTDTQFYIIILVMIVGILIELIGIFMGERASIEYDSPLLGNILKIIGICIFVAIFVYLQVINKSNNENVVEQYKEGNSTLYIDGNPVENDFDIDGIDIGKYTVKVDGDKIYLMSK